MSRFVCVLIDLRKGLVCQSCVSHFCLHKVLSVFSHIFQRSCVKSKIGIFLLFMISWYRELTMHSCPCQLSEFFFFNYLYVCFSHFILIQLIFYYFKQLHILNANSSSAVFTHMHITNTFPIQYIFMIFRLVCDLLVLLNFANQSFMFEVSIPVFMGAIAIDLLGGGDSRTEFIDIIGFIHIMWYCRTGIQDRTHYVSKETVIRSRVVCSRKILNISYARA